MAAKTPSNGALSREAILGAQDIKTELVEVPEWGGSVHVRGLSGVERDAFEMSMVTIRGKKREMTARNVRARLVCWCTVDAEGNRVFVDDDENTLGTKSGAALDKIFVVAQRLSGLREEDIEELTADFPRAGGGASNSASPVS